MNNPSDPLAALHNRYDGRPPATARAAALAGDPALLAQQRREAAARLAAGKAGEAWRGLVARRRALSARRLSGDAWLGRLVGELARCRALAVAAHDQTRYRAEP